MSKSARRTKKRKLCEIEDIKIGLCDMPTEILMKIMEHLTVWDQFRVRGTCHFLRNICDSSLMHLYKKSLFKWTGEGDGSYEAAALKGIHQACWAYIEAGFTHTFLGTLLARVRESSGFYPFGPQIDKIRKFLRTFYQIVNENDQSSLKARLLFAVTLLGFLKDCPNSSITFSKMYSSQYRREVYELKGSWIGLLWSSRTQQSLNNWNDRKVLMVLLSEIMINVLCGKPFRRVWDSENHIFVYGHDICETRRTYPKTFVTLDLHGSKKILNFIETAANTKTFTKWPHDEFHLSLKLFCPKSVLWGCYRTYFLDVGPPDGDLEELPMIDSDSTMDTTNDDDGFDDEDDEFSYSSMIIPL